MHKKYTIFSDYLTNGNNLNFVPVNNVSKFKINRIVVPTSFNCISSARNNNTIVIDAYTCTIPDGTYSISDLCSYLQAQLILNVDATFTCTYSTINKSVTIAETTANFTFNLSNSKAAKLLGFASSGTLTGAKTYTSTLSYNPYDLNSILLSVDRFKQMTFSESNTTVPYFICSIPVDVLPDDYIIYEPNYPVEFDLKNIEGVISNVTLNFYFKEGIMINFNGIGWSIELEFI